MDEVAARQITDRVDIGTRTWFLYAKSKGELLLLVQNSAFADALVNGKAAAGEAPGVLDAVMAIVGPVVECHR